MSLYDQILKTLGASAGDRLFIVDVYGNSDDHDNNVAVFADTIERARDLAIASLARDHWEYDYGTVYAMGPSKQHANELTWHHEPSLYFTKPT